MTSLLTFLWPLPCSSRASSSWHWQMPQVMLMRITHDDLSATRTGLAWCNFVLEKPCVTFLNKPCLSLWEPRHLDTDLLNQLFDSCFIRIFGIKGSFEIWVEGLHGSPMLHEMPRKLGCKFQALQLDAFCTCLRGLIQDLRHQCIGFPQQSEEFAEEMAILGGYDMGTLGVF